MDTLAFGYILPATGRIRDFHPLETCAARRTVIKSPLVIFMTGGFSSIFIVRLITIFLLLSRSVFDTVEDLVAFHIEIPYDLFIRQKSG